MFYLHKNTHTHTHTLSLSLTLPPFFQFSQYMHKRDIVHRDLKPENIIVQVQHGDTIKLCDFGLSVVVGKGVSGDVGSPTYMAPEVVSNSEPSVLLSFIVCVCVFIHFVFLYLFQPMLLFGLLFVCLFFILFALFFFRLFFFFETLPSRLDMAFLWTCGLLGWLHTLCCLASRPLAKAILWITRTCTTTFWRWITRSPSNSFNVRMKKKKEKKQKEKERKKEKEKEKEKKERKKEKRQSKPHHFVINRHISSSHRLYLQFTCSWPDVANDRWSGMLRLWRTSCFSTLF